MPGIVYSYLINPIRGAGDAGDSDAKRCGEKAPEFRVGSELCWTNRIWVYENIHQANNERPGRGGMRVEEMAVELTDNWRKE